MRNKAIAALFIFLAGILFVSNPVFAAWTQAKGHAYNQLSWSYYVTDKKFTTVKMNTDGIARSTGGGISKVQTAKFVSTGFTYYGEYGITDIVTVFTAIPYKWAYSEDIRKYAYENGPGGLGDIDLGLRYNLSQNFLGNVMSLQGAVKIPDGYHYGNPLERLSMGDGQYDATLLLQLGRGIGKGYAWLNAGYKYRFENNKSKTDQSVPLSFKPSDQIKISFGGGYAVTEKLSVRGIIDWTKSVGNASVSQSLIEDNYSHGGLSESQENTLIRDSLGLEPDALSAGVDLAFNITPQWQAVASYNTDLEGIDIFESKDWALGQTYSLAVVYMF